MNDTELIFPWTNVFRNNDIPYISEVTDSSAATEIVHDICVQLVEKIDIMLELQPQICKLFMKVCIRVITKLPNSEQSNKGKVKTHNYINRQNQSTTGKTVKTVMTLT